MEVIGSIYTGVTADFQRGLYPIARCVKAGNHDLGVVLMKQRRLGNLYGDDRGTGFAGNVWDKNYISPSLTTAQGGMREPMIVDKQIVAMCGRNPDNPSDRTAGSPTEQRLEPNMQGISNCLTSVQKENLVLIKQATKEGSIECEIGGCFDASYPESTTRRGRVQDKGNICQPLRHRIKRL